MKFLQSAGVSASVSDVTRSLFRCFILHLLSGNFLQTTGTHLSECGAVSEEIRGAMSVRDSHIRRVSATPGKFAPKRISLFACEVVTQGTKLKN